MKDNIHIQLPDLFLARLSEILNQSKPNFISNKDLERFFDERPISLRINILQRSVESLLKDLRNKGLEHRQPAWSKEALQIFNIKRHDLHDWELIQEGAVYIQSLSSMLPALILNPQPGERILDMCAAPGSKTTQIAALMRNEGEILAVENIKKRFYRLRSVVQLLGADIVNFKLMDARRFRAGEHFDRILVDAPCSSEGRFNRDNQKSFAYWSLRKIREMVRKQRGLLLNATRLIKPGGRIVYSTCTFAPEENEGVIDWLLRKMEGTMEVESVVFNEIKTYPALTSWGKKIFDDQVKKCCRILPTQDMEGFFITSLKKKG